MRRHFNKNVDFNLFDYMGRQSLRKNFVNPEIFVGPVWLHDEPPAVEIIELNSSDDVNVTPRPTNDTMRDAWSYTNDHDLEQMEDNYKINKKARERRRVEIENKTRLPSPNVSKKANNHNEIPNSFYRNYSEDKMRFNHQMNCFTIINKHVIDSDASTEGEYGDVEIITSSDILLGTGGWDTMHSNYDNEETFTYDANINQETRTVWIYSYKNKNLLPDDDSATNNPNKSNSSSNTSFSTDSSGDVKDPSTYSRRLGSPMPHTYIPRLDLSLLPTLSTVTEISENIQISPNKNNKRCNNWFLSESAKLNGSKSIQKEEKSTNIINWMALSPRERYRVLNDSGTSDTWVGSHLHLAEIHKQNKIGNHGEEESDETTQEENDTVKIKVNADVHVNMSDNNENTTITELDGTGAAVKYKNYVINSIKDLKYVDIETEDSHKDRGDHYKKSPNAPTIRITSKHHKCTNITDPIEKLDSNNWIKENEEEKETSTYNYEIETSECFVNDKNIDTIDHMWMKNSVPFLKPSEWTEFVPIAESPISFHLSLGSITEERKPWFKRIINFINCCK